MMRQKNKNNSLLFQDEQAARMADKMLANSPPSPGNRKRKSKIINAHEEKNIKRMMDALDDLSEQTPPLFESSWYDTNSIVALTA